MRITNKFEIRSTKFETNSKSQIPNKSAIRNPQSAMSFSHSAIRIPKFEIRNSFFHSVLLLFFTFPFLLPTSYLFSQSGWGPDTRLVFLPGGGWYPRAACCGDTIHLVWYQRYSNPEPHEEVFYKRSTDAGLTWGEDVMLSMEDGQSSVLPEIAVSGNTVHVIWFEDDFGVLYRRSTDGGANWENIDSIIPGMTYSSIHALGDTVFIAGTIGSLGVLRFTKSFDGGNSWRPIIEITRASSSPRIRSINNNSLRLVISYDKGGSPLCAEVYQVLSYDCGETWFDSVKISHDDFMGSQWPAMATDSNNGIHISWYDYKYSPYSWTGDIFYRVSRDSGSTWAEIDSLTVMHRAVASDILAEGNNLHLVWEDDRNGFDNNFEIYYRMSTDLGRTWGLEERLTNAPYKSIGPSLACGGGYLHLFWRDCRDSANNGIGFIYYKRKDLNVGITQEVGRFLNFSNLILDCPTILMHNSFIRYNLGKNKNGEINLIDVTGRVIVTVPVHQVSGEFALETFNKEVQHGVYFLMLKAGKECVIRKVIKIK